jgi:riboflavin kinase / FMN adenylyltransferase
VNVYYHIDEIGAVAHPVVTTGTFDGVHAGHRQIIARLRETAVRVGGETILLTFFPHPRMVLFPDRMQVLLNTQAEKIALLEKAGIDHLVIHPFTREFSMLDSRAFVEDVLVKKFRTERLVIGYDHHFGRDREGSFEHLRQFGPVYGFEVEEIPAHEVDHVEVSSTKIRNAIQTGDVSTANHLLGYAYPLSGTVVKGRQLGRTIGFPTANLQVLDAYKLIPADGVYAVWVTIKNTLWPAMMNIGMRPTVDGLHRTLEVHVLNFEGDLYGEQISLRFAARLRDEKKFENLDALKAQLHTDREQTLNILTNENVPKN